MLFSSLLTKVLSINLYLKFTSWLRKWSADGKVGFANLLLYRLMSKFSSFKISLSITLLLLEVRCAIYVKKFAEFCCETVLETLPRSNYSYRLTVSESFLTIYCWAVLFLPYTWSVFSFEFMLSVANYKLILFWTFRYLLCIYVFGLWFVELWRSLLGVKTIGSNAS